MTDLIARIEKAQPSEARKLFAFAYDACFPELRFDGHTQRFIAFLDAQAYLDAAAMFVPEGWARKANDWPGAPSDCQLWETEVQDGRAFHLAHHLRVKATATTPYYALLAAAMKARQTDEQ